MLVNSLNKIKRAKMEDVYESSPRERQTESPVVSRNKYIRTEEEKKKFGQDQEGRRRLSQVGRCGTMPEGESRRERRDLSRRQA